MIKYTISYKKPHQHYIDFEATITNNGAKTIQLQLAAWRPGRYELQNYAQKIQKWQAYNKDGEVLQFKKITKDLWEINTENIAEIIIKYNFYANELDAGSSYLDEHQLYINPVNCMFYIVNRNDEEYIITLKIPKTYKIASSMQQQGNILKVKGYDLLAESPIICSEGIQHDTYKINDIIFNLWFQGDCKPDWKRIKNDFQKFTKTQIKYFDSFPVNEYHFLFQITPYKSYHGVEHTKNTVILLGPGNEIMSKRYEELLGICSHELYHTWNIKAIRPIEMLPYNYTKENYFRTGFVAEGVTTYMGDLMLYKSGVFDWTQFVKTQNQNLERHLTNYGRFNLSVAESGFDNWLDGYKLGIPNRTTSIYPDAALCMLMIDLEIIYATNGKESLNSVMNLLYKNFGLKTKGYSEEIFRSVCVKFGGIKVEKIFNNHIYGIQDYIPTLKSSLEHIGVKLQKKDNANITAKYFGFISISQNGKTVIKKVEPNSEADKKGIVPEDEIIKCNNKKINGNLSNMLKGYTKSVSLTIKKRFSEKTISLKIGNHYQLLELVKQMKTSKKQLRLRKIWGT